MEHRDNVDLSLFMQLAKVSKSKMNEKEAMSIRVCTLNMQLGKLIVVFYSFF